MQKEKDLIDYKCKQTEIWSFMTEIMMPFGQATLLEEEKQVTML
jgi:hypothetical protein